MATEKIHWLETGPIPVNIGLTSSKKALDELSISLSVKEELFPTEMPAKALMFTNDDIGGLIVVCINEEFEKKMSWEEFAGIVAHEALHVLQYINEYTREPSPAIEQQAYAIQWLVHNFLEIYKNGSQA